MLLMRLITRIKRIKKIHRDLNGNFEPPQIHYGKSWCLHCWFKEGFCSSADFTCKSMQKTFLSGYHEISGDLRQNLSALLGNRWIKSQRNCKRKFPRHEKRHPKNILLKREHIFPTLCSLNSWKFSWLLQAINRLWI